MTALIIANANRNAQKREPVRKPNSRKIYFTFFLFPISFNINPFAIIPTQSHS